VTRVVVVSGRRPSHSQLAALWMRDVCLTPAGFGSALIPGYLFRGAVSSHVADVSSDNGVLAAETSRNISGHQLLPAAVIGSAAHDHGLSPESARDWLRLFLFVVLGISLMFAIRFTARDLGR
jgi:hypothetical protein